MNDDVISNLVEVSLDNPDCFLKIKETLTRIGIPSYKDKKLYQSCHILHKKGRYYIVHFKELFALDGKKSTLTDDDVARRNTIAKLLQEWDLLKITNPEILLEYAPMTSIKIVAHKDKFNWELVPKYIIGVRH
jgi:hypothetical protein